MEQQIPPKFLVGDVPTSILDVKTKNDFVYETVQTIAPQIAGYEPLPPP